MRGQLMSSSHLSREISILRESKIRPQSLVATNLWRLCMTRCHLQWIVRCLSRLQQKQLWRRMTSLKTRVHHLTSRPGSLGPNENAAWVDARRAKFDPHVKALDGSFILDYRMSAFPSPITPSPFKNMLKTVTLITGPSSLRGLRTSAHQPMTPPFSQPPEYDVWGFGRPIPISLLWRNYNNTPTFAKCSRLE